MRRIFHLTILAVALAALSVTAAARVGRSEAEPVTSATAPASPPPTQASLETHPRPAMSNPDPLHSQGRLIEVSIPRQMLTAWRDGHIMARFTISTGRPGYETPTGNYNIIAKNPNAWSRKWKVWMPWAMNWHGNYFIHQLPHYPGSTVNIGASKLGTPASHGCIRVNVGDAEWLFHWTATGTPVWVH